MPWELVGSLPLEEFQAHLAGRSQMAGEQHLIPGTQGPKAQFSSIELGKFPPEPLPRTQDLGFRDTCKLEAGSSLTWSGPWSPGLCKNQRTAAWGDLGRHSRKVLLCSVPKTVVVAAGPAAFPGGGGGGSSQGLSKSPRQCSRDLNIHQSPSQSLCPKTPTPV